MGSESKLTWHPLRKVLTVKGWVYQRIEDRSTVGVPDLNVHVPGVGDVWIELKHHARIPVRSINLGLSQQQYLWLRSNQLAGRLCCLLCRVGSLWCLWTDIESYKLATQSTPWTKLVSKVECMYDDPHLVVQHLAKEIVNL